MDSPWVLNKEWASGRITSKSGTRAIGAWIFAGLSNALIWTVTILIWHYDRDSIKIAAFFCPIGIGLFVWAIRQSWRWFRHGSSVLELASILGVIGGTLEGVIHTRLRRFPTKPIEVTLTCNRQYLHKAPSRSKEGDHYDTAVLWQADRSVAANRLNHGPHGVSFPVRIQIPNGLPANDNSDEDEQIFWKVEASCDVPGIDFQSEFLVPVFVTEKSNPEWTEEKVDEMIEGEEKTELTPEASRAVIGETPVTIKPTKSGGMEYIFRINLPIKIDILLPVYGVLITGGSALFYL